VNAGLGRLVRAAFDWTDDHFEGIADLIVTAIGAGLFVLCLATLVAIIAS
jgi:hypothetical protein